MHTPKLRRLALLAAACLVSLAPSAGLAAEPGVAVPAARPRCAAFANGPRALYRVDLDRGLVATENPLSLPPGEELTDLAFAGATGFAISFGTLYKLDARTAELTRLGPLDGAFNALAESEGKLFAATTSGVLYAFDLREGRATPLLEFPAGLASSGDLVALADGTLLATAVRDGGADVLLRIDSRARTSREVGPAPARGLYGLSVCGGTVFAFAEDGTVWALDPETGRGTVRARLGVTIWGAAGLPERVPTS